MSIEQSFIDTKNGILQELQNRNVPDIRLNRISDQDLGFIFCFACIRLCNFTGICATLLPLSTDSLASVSSSPEGVFYGLCVT